MARIHWTTATVLAVTLIVAACGGGGATATPGGTSPTGPTVAPTSGGGGAGGTGIGGAAAKLEDLSSYKFAISMVAEGTATFSLLRSGGTLTISGTVVLKPTIAMDMEMTTKDATAELVVGSRIIGDKAWTSFGGAWMETKATNAQSTIDAFKPEKFMAGFGSLDDLKSVGDETKNGMATTHYKGAAPTSLGSTFGMPKATWTVEAWVAKDGGYLVGSALVGEASDGKFTMSMDISDIDSPGNKVEAPEDFTPLGG